MEQFLEFLKQLNKDCKVNFDVLSEDIKFSSIKTHTKDICSINVNIGNKVGIIRLNQKDKNCAFLLKHIIEKKYDEMFLNKIKFLNKILNGENVAIPSYNNKYIKLFEKGMKMILIYTQGNNFEGVNIIKSFYEKENIICFGFNKYIIVMSSFENMEEHANALKELITSNLYYKCYIVYSDESIGLNKVKKTYDKLLEVLKIGVKYKIKPQVYSIEDMKLEKIISNINNDMKNGLLSKHKSKLDLLDNDIINTIEEFINCDLNVSNAAKKLYIHRNTLIYRLDKIKKETGFDITNFKEAMTFYAVFLLWKESKGDDEV